MGYYEDVGLEVGIVAAAEKFQTGLTDKDEGLGLPMDFLHYFTICRYRRETLPVIKCRSSLTPLSIWSRALSIYLT